MYVCIRNERDAISFANVAPSILLRRVLNVCPLVLVTFFFFCFIKSLLLLYIGTFKSAHLDASSRRRRRSFFSSPPPIYSPPRASSSPRGFRAAISIPKILLTKRPMRTVNARIETMSLRKKKKKETQKRKEKNDDPSRKSLVSRLVQTSLSIIKQQTDNPFGRSFLCFHSSRYVCPSKLRNILHSFYRRNFGERAALVARYVCTYIVTKILVKLVIARATVARARSEIKTRIKREVHYAASSLIGPPSTREYLEPGILRCPERKKKPPPLPPTVPALVGTPSPLFSQLGTLFAFVIEYPVEEEHPSNTLSQLRFLPSSSFSSSFSPPEEIVSPRTRRFANVRWLVSS